MKTDSIRPYVVDKLRYALDPRSIAVVGAARYPEKVGYKIIQGLKDWKYQGNIIPVNPRAESVHGLKAYKTLRDIPGEVDLAFIALPAHLIKMVLEDCVAKKVKVVVIASSGFKEIGRASLQDELTLYCREHKLPLIGPNLLGMGSPYSNFNCGFIPYLPVAGPVAMISQSGANLLAALGVSRTTQFGMSFFVGLGNKADVDFCEFVAYAGQDPNSKCVSVYIEGLDSEQAFIEACKRVAPAKPVVTIKVGGSKIGGQAAFAHTASDAGPSDAHYDEVFEQAGAIRAKTWEEFLDTSLALGFMPPLAGDRIVMITNGGGAGLLACDDFERRGLPLHPLKEISSGLSQRIKAYMPMFGSPLNPVDISGTANEIQYHGALTQAIRDPNVDGLIVSICPTAVTNVAAIADVILKVHREYEALGKPIIAELQGGAECDEAILRLREAGVPAYPTPERAVSAMVALRRYAQIRERMQNSEPALAAAK
jgi:acyl-CoA synthetase (NDP forming)